MREGPLHAAVKALLAEPGDALEVPVGRFVVDVVRADGELVDEHRIRVVHPVAAECRIVRVDEQGQLLGARRSPKRATAAAVFDKLVAFPSLLTHPSLTIEVLLLREDHIRRPQRRRLAVAPEIRGSGGWFGSSTGSRCGRRRTSSRRSHVAA
jgi:hypothetical protein